MDQTFALRRKEIVEEQPPVSRMVERWPALFTETQIYDEFSRVASKNLRQQFYEALDRHTPSLIRMMKSKRGKVGQSLEGFLRQIDSQVMTVSSAGFVLTCAQVPVGILTVISEDDPNRNATSLHLNPTSVAVILEGEIVLDDLSSYAEAFCLLVGLIYALHIDYPKSMRYSFEFIQKVLLDIGQTKLSPKMQTLKNSLSS
ncbi:hypothetical protein N1851_008533 [Merluccius polli]|uniref:Uncharacterized protein n=1 Tax=Merluccius polli TaxID=89951 RepID=A0AA47P4I4_MERPO|nr:hypothetical protein N1851_008533 [Merluccius polli]